MMMIMISFDLSQNNSFYAFAKHADGRVINRFKLFTHQSLFRPSEVAGDRIIRYIVTLPDPVPLPLVDPTFDEPGDEEMIAYFACCDVDEPDDILLTRRYGRFDPPVD